MISDDTQSHNLQFTFMFIVGEYNIDALKMLINFWCKQVVHFSNIDVHSNIVFFCIAPNIWVKI